VAVVAVVAGMTGMAVIVTVGDRGGVGVHAFSGRFRVRRGDRTRPLR